MIDSFKTPDTKGKIRTYKLIQKRAKESKNGTVKKLKKEIERLKEYLKFYDDIFKDNLDYLMENEIIDKYIEENEKKFDKIEMVINNA